MYRISLIINEIYSKYLPIAEKANIRFDLDIRTPEQQTDAPEQLKLDLEKHLESALKRSKKAEVKIRAEKNRIVITDTGSTLSPTACALLSRGKIKVKSRVGFGTSVEFDLSTNKNS